MKNTPETIFLNTGEEEVFYDDFNEVEEITWSPDWVNPNDTKYIREDIYDKDISDARIVEVAGMISEEECEAKEKEAFQEGWNAPFMSGDAFTKEQMIEFGRKAWIACVKDSKKGSGWKSYSEWLEQEKPFDSK